MSPERLTSAAMQRVSGMNRRHFLRTSFACTLASFVPAALLATQQDEPFQLDPLPYSFDALEPHIDARTMQLHFEKHHGGYVRKLNAALRSAPPELRSMEVEELCRQIKAMPVTLQPALRKFAGGHANHRLFWSILSPDPKTTPQGPLAEALDRSFGSLDAFKRSFKDAALSRFGSGFVWLTAKPDGSLAISSTPNQQNTLMLDPVAVPLLVIDVWEHAYYLKYQNRRADYVDAFWNVMDWAAVESRFADAFQA